MLVGGLGREKRVLSRTRVCVDRIGAFEYLSEGEFCPPFPPSFGTTAESLMSLGQACPTRHAHADKLGRSALSSGVNGPRIVDIAA
jgi:hypothetical protein